ncbi:hypothetical protein RRF57_009008 [Xylaria bambusicola]|uniref:Uncharacterized protein n=1 Tax=Xylaria bambusicola TaxID=326684 RepID=A0AAN7USZ8_9PEZI
MTHLNPLRRRILISVLSLRIHNQLIRLLNLPLHRRVRLNALLNTLIRQRRDVRDRQAPPHARPLEAAMEPLADVRELLFQDDARESRDVDPADEADVGDAELVPDDIVAAF